MLKKFIAIKNVGRFRNSAIAGNPQLGRNTLILGANGFGKTTLCAVLRSAQTGEAAHVVGRKTLGGIDNPTVELLLDTGIARFDGATWSATVPNLMIFDGTFVSENVHSGEVVEIGHKRNLYRVIIGRAGVHLAEEDNRLTTESRTKTTEITAAAKVLQTHIPTGITLAQFLVLPADAGIDAKIAEQQRAIEAAQRATQIQARTALSEYSLIKLPDTLAALLAQTVDGIAADAEQQLQQHLSAHGMTEDGEAWISDGMKHGADDTCPFCGQDTRGLPLISAYRAVFGAAYRNLVTQLAAARTTINEQLGGGVIGQFSTRAAENRAAIEFWQRYCTFAEGSIDPPRNIAEGIRAARDAAIALLDQKARSPLDIVLFDEKFTEANSKLEALEREVVVVNTAIRGTNAIIAAKKSETGKADLKAAETELARRNAIKKRQEPEIVNACAAYSRLVGEKEKIESQRARARARLEAHTANVVKPYERQINRYLDTFNAGFRIAETKHSYPAGVATSSYQLVINNTTIEIGDGKTPVDKPSFKNTLSAGDRTTLALAFFLAHLDGDADRADKIVVFDDPFNSQDAFRRRQTIYEIGKIGRTCSQVITLSHDATFLKPIWEKAQPADRAAIQIVDGHVQGSKIYLADLDKACQGRMASEIDDLQAYIATGAGKALDQIKKIRVVLETHCHTTYPGYFEATDWLGDIVGKISRAPEDHPAKPLYSELDRIHPAKAAAEV